MTINELADKMIQMRFFAPEDLVSVPESIPNRGEERVLLFLYKQSSHIMVGDLTEAFGLSTGRMANILRQLEEKNMITRTQQKDDKRKYEVTLTKKGLKHVEELFKDLQEAHQKFLKQMGKKDAEELLRLLEKAVKISDSHC